MAFYNESLSGEPGVKLQGGGALRYQMATHCQTAAQSGSGEHQYIYSPLKDKKGGRSTSK